MEGSQVTGIAWYRREQWSRLRKVSADREEIEDTYEEWLASVQSALATMASSGVHPEKVEVDVDALVRWCRAQDRPVDGAARAAFVAAKMRRES